MWPVSLQKCGISIAAAGSSARTKTISPSSMDLRCFLSFSTGNGQRRPVASKFFLSYKFVAFSIIRLFKSLIVSG